MRRSRGEVPLHPRYKLWSITTVMAVMGVAARTALYCVITVTICAISPYPSARHAVLTQIRLNYATLSLDSCLCQRVQQHLHYH